MTLLGVFVSVYRMTIVFDSDHARMIMIKSKDITRLQNITLRRTILHTAAWEGGGEVLRVRRVSPLSALTRRDSESDVMPFLDALESRQAGSSITNK